MTIKRRELLEGASVALASLLVPSVLGGCDDEAVGPTGCDPVDHPLPSGLPEYAYDGPLGPTTLFEHGVVSGDPEVDRVILWTRVSPTNPGPAVEVFYEVALDADFARRVVATTTSTDASRDFTVKVDPTGLRAATTYYYRFRALGITSAIGRTRTLPSGSVSHLRFGMMSCSSLGHGYFHAYEDIAARDDLDLVLHLGDYIYEYPDGEYGDVRAYDPPNECLTLDDYRRRFKQYRKDPMLQAAHRQHPFVCIWDDHEVANDTYAAGAENHMPGEGDFGARRAAAMQAYFEYQPIREAAPGQVHRSLRCGDLVDLIMLETRQVGRSKQRAGSEPDDASRTMLGAAQESWLNAQLSSSTSRWVMLGQQVMVSQFSFVGDPNQPFNMDAWDGYALARERLFAAIESHAAGRTVILTGDIHSSWAGDVSRNPWDPAIYDPTTGTGAIAVEFVTPGVTSPGGAATPDGEDFLGELVLSKSPHLKLGDFVHKGYVVLDIRPTRVQADWFHIASVEDPDEGTVEFGFAAAVEHGKPRLKVMDRPTVGKRNACRLAP